MQVFSLLAGEEKVYHRDFVSRFDQIWRREEEEEEAVN